MGAIMGKSSAKIETKSPTATATATAVATTAKPVVKGKTAVAERKVPAKVPATVATPAKDAKPAVVKEAKPTLNSFCVPSGYTGDAVVFAGSVVPCTVVSHRGDTCTIRVDGRERATSRGLVFPNKEAVVKAVAWASGVIRTPLTTYTPGHGDPATAYAERTHTGTKVAFFSADDPAFGSTLYQGYVYDGSSDYQPPGEREVGFIAVDCYQDQTVSYVRIADLRDPIAGTDPVCQLLASTYVDAKRAELFSQGLVNLRTSEVDTGPRGKRPTGDRPTVKPAVKEPAKVPTAKPAVATAGKSLPVTAFGKDFSIPVGTDGVVIDWRKHVSAILTAGGFRDLAKRILAGEKSADVFANIPRTQDREALKWIVQSGKARTVKAA